MYAIYDIVGSAVIGGIVLLMLLSFNTAVMEGAAIQTFESNVQANLTSVTDVVEYDFRKIGFRVGTILDSGIVYADSAKIQMKGDINNDGTVDKVTYYLDLTTKSGHQNPRTRVLYRQVNSAPAQAINLGITKFTMTYCDSAGARITQNPVKNPSLIRSIDLLVTLESLSLFNGKYAGTTWDRSITPKNLR